LGDRVTVTIADDQLADIDSTVERLREAGMKVDQVLGAVGIVTGTVSPSERSKIAAVPGVAAVEDETSYQLPPPDSDVQ
jgi:hypothetical protein